MWECVVFSNHFTDHKLCSFTNLLLKCSIVEYLPAILLPLQHFHTPINHPYKPSTLSLDTSFPSLSITHLILRTLFSNSIHSQKLCSYLTSLTIFHSPLRLIQDIIFVYPHSKNFIPLFTTFSNFIHRLAFSTSLHSPNRMLRVISFTDLPSLALHSCPMPQRRADAAANRL